MHLLPCLCTIWVPQNRKVPELEEVTRTLVFFLLTSQRRFFWSRNVFQPCPTSCFSTNTDFPRLRQKEHSITSPSGRLDPTHSVFWVTFELVFPNNHLPGRLQTLLIQSLNEMMSLILKVILQFIADWFPLFITCSSIFSGTWVLPLHCWLCDEIGCVIPLEHISLEKCPAGMIPLAGTKSCLISMDKCLLKGRERVGCSP